MYFKPSAISWQILSQSPTEMIPLVLALYTVITLQSLPPVRISIIKDVLFVAPYIYGKNLKPCRTANTLASLTALNKLCLMFFCCFYNTMYVQSFEKAQFDYTKPSFS